MIFTTNDGREINVGITHKWVTVPRYPNQPVRTTCMWLHSTTPSGQPIDIETSTVCSPRDQFSRRRGRQLVRQSFMPQFELSRLVAVDQNVYEEIPAIKYYFDREDRKKIYKALLPEFHTDRYAQVRNLLNRLRKLAFLKPQEKAIQELDYKYNSIEEQWQERINEYLNEPAIC